MLLTPAQIKPKSSELRQPLFILPGVDESHVYMSVRALGCFPQSYQYQNLSEGADCVGGQLRRDKECPFSGITKSGRVWRKVPESGARTRSVLLSLSLNQQLPDSDSVANKYTFSQTSWGTQDYTGYFNIKYTSTHLTLTYLMKHCETFWSSASERFHIKNKNSCKQDEDWIETWVQAVSVKASNMTIFFLVVKKDSGVSTVNCFKVAP